MAECELFVCCYCAFRASLWRSYMRHIFECHSHVPGFSFTCGLSGCTRSFTNYSAMQSHISRIHPTVSEAPDPSVFGCHMVNDALINIDEEDVDVHYEMETEDHDCDANPLQTAAAKFLLMLKEQHRLTQVAINYLVDQVKKIVCTVVTAIKHKIQSQLSADHMSTIENCFADFNPFEGLETEYKQTKYYREHFNLVEPTTVKLGSMVDNDSFQYVPLFSGLRSLLCNDSVFDEVVRYNRRFDGFMSDFCDGELYISHDLYSNNGKALQLILYFDEVEPFNVLGSAAGKYKLGMFYYILGNLRPELRSTHRAVQLVACVTVPVLNKYGFAAILKPFITDVTKLNNEGLMIVKKGREYNFHGTVLLTLADTLAAHQLGGYKEGVGFSLRKCRDCMATFNDMQTKFTEEQLQLRSPAAYDYQCTLLEGSSSAYDSTTYGINYRSPLNAIPGFHAASGQLPQDIMHVLFEGVLPLEVKLMLRAFIAKKYFSIDFLNDRIDNFVYGKAECRNKPPKSLDLTATEGSLKLSAIQMWSFAINLPLIIGDKVPEDDPMWECFILLLEITKYCTARVTSKESADYITALVDQHHRDFRKCYPKQNFTPKLHYMVHLSRTMKLTGPLINCWTMRMEAKNSFFKRVSQIGNYRNVPYSISRRHQRLLCAYLNGPFFTYEDLEFGPCKESEITTLLGDKYESNISANIPDIDLSVSVHRPNWIKCYGEEFHHSCFIHCGWNDNLPLFGRVLEILIVAETMPFLAIEEYNTEKLDSHLSSFLISRTLQTSVVYMPTLESRFPLYAHTYFGDNKPYIALKSHIQKI